MNDSRIFLGPMSKNIVNTVIEYSNEFNLPFTFIPSRRQVEYNGGYVNNWTTRTFIDYVKYLTKLNKNSVSLEALNKYKNNLIYSKLA